MPAPIARAAVMGGDSIGKVPVENSSIAERYSPSKRPPKPDAVGILLRMVNVTAMAECCQA